MGDRVLFQMTRKAEHGPVVYGHWSGSAAREIVTKLKDRMASRRGDVSYATARLVQEVCETVSDKALSVGVWNADEVLVEKDSHGDAGIVLIDADTFRCVCFGGYLKADSKGLPAKQLEAA